MRHDTQRASGIWKSLVFNSGVTHWRTPHHGELRWPVTLIVLVAIGTQYLMPEYLRLPGRAIFFFIEASLLFALFVLDPHRISRHQQRTRIISLLLTGVLTVANVGAIGRLIHALVNGEVKEATHLLTAGGSVWFINVVVFSLWFWELDRGGPGKRAEAVHPYPAFYFPQMQDASLAPQWHATYFDYLYVSVTNSTAFSPTDTMPLTWWAKALMMLQSLISLVAVGLVIARAVNILQ